MSGLTWIILDAVLALAAVFGVVKVAVTPPPKPIPTAQLEISEEEAKKAEKPQKETQKSDLAAPHADALPPKASLDDLWKETLFLPGRAEAEPGDAEEEAAAAAAALAGKNFEFELVGIAQISPTGAKPTPVAILRSKQTNARTQRGRGPTGRGNRDAKSAPAREEKKPAERLVFKEGDPINATGYLIKAIHTDQKMVEVSRGSETIKLTINFAGEEANKRRDAVNQASAKRRQEAEQAEQQQRSIRARQAQEAAQHQASAQAQQDANPGAPPSPPGAAGTQPATGNPGGSQQPAGGNDGGDSSGSTPQTPRERAQSRARQRSGGQQTSPPTTPPVR